MAMASICCSCRYYPPRRRRSCPTTQVSPREVNALQIVESMVQAGSATAPGAHLHLLNTQPPTAAGAGQTLVILAGGEGIDLSVGAVTTLGAILTFRLTAQWGAGPVILVALAAGLAIWGANGLGVTQLGYLPW